MSMHAYQAYKSATVQTSPPKLLIMLYDGLIRDIELGKTAIEQAQIMEANTQLINAQNIVLELKNSLNTEFEISKSLTSLYDYFYRELVQANVQKSCEPLNNILPIVKDLRETWYKASLMTNAAAQA